jgi:plastocyanin
MTKQRRLTLTKPWRAFGVVALAAVMTLGLAACGTDEEDPEAGDDVPNVSVTPLQPETEGTGVPRPQDGTPEASVVVPSETTPSTGAGNEADEVAISDDLNMDDVTISAGDSITWTNEDDVAHTITSSEGGDWDSGEIDEEIPAGESFTHQFTEPGTYPLTLDEGETTWTVTVE